MNSHTTVAQQVARDASRTIRTIYFRLEALNPEQRADDELFLRCYEQIESELIAGIRSAYPSHTIQAKYHDTRENESYHRWYISGMTAEENFRAGRPNFSVSIAYEMGGKLQSAVVYNPVLDEMSVASRTEGALFNDQKLRAPKNDGKLENAHLLTKIGRTVVDHEQFAKLQRNAKSIMCYGDVAGDIIQTARGLASGFYSGAHLAEEDIAGAVLIAREAGLLVTDFRGSEENLMSGEIVVVAPRLLKEMLVALK